MSSYTIKARTVDPDTHKFVGEPEYFAEMSMPFHWADSKAAELNGMYGPLRQYSAVNVSEMSKCPS